MNALKILVVDDDRDAAEGLADVFEMEGHTVTLAHDGLEAVAKFSEFDFDIAFMDVMMPGMNGVDSFFEIRKLKPEARVFMMTGYSLQQLLDRAMENGALGILSKPVEMDQVLEILDGIKPSGLILIADDDPHFGQGLKEVLADHDYEVELVQNGREALERVAAGGVEVLILDLKLPGLGGLEVYTALKERNCVVPTIVVTGHAAEKGSDLDALRNMSVSEIFTKPFRPELLLDSLRNRQQPTRT